MSKVTIKDESILKGALSILYNLDKVLDTLENIGINVEDGGPEDSIGRGIYGSSTECYYIIIENCFEGTGPSDDIVIAEIIECLYNGIDSKEEAIKKTIDSFKEHFDIED